ncbi:MAG: hypothetical protein HKN37_03415, partial [Rhodothermales bacterium]|nr:hypothetical protein [Rhodothermales bacterium]
MGDISKSLGLGVFGFFVGLYLGGLPGAFWGWSAGSTLGSFLDMQGSGSYTEGKRLTDFKALNSKYGIPIPRGYGSARFGGNMIWSSPVREVEEIQKSCAQTGPAFFGLPINQSCNVVVTFRYYQSAAIAFAEGPACAVPRVWADGQVVVDTRPINAPGVAMLTHRRADISPCRPESIAAFKVYLGTATQQVDPRVAFWDGPENSESGLDEAIPFRNIVYVMVTDIDLEPYGYRIPVLSAEVSFQNCDPPVFTYMDESELHVNNNGGIRMGWDQGGLVRRRPNIGWGYSALSGVRTLHDFLTGRIIFQNEAERGVPWAMFSAAGGLTRDMGPNYEIVDAYFPFGDVFFSSVSNFITGYQSVILRLELPLAFWGRTGTSFFDELRSGFWSVFALGSGIVFYPASNAESEEFTEFRQVETFNPETNELEVSTVGYIRDRLPQTSGFTTGNSPYLDTIGDPGDEGKLKYHQLYEGEPLADRGGYVFPDTECGIWWLANGSAGDFTYLSYLKPIAGNIVEPLGSLHIKFSDGTPVSGASVAYCPTNDVMLFHVGTKLYKVTREDAVGRFGTIPLELLLPVETETELVIDYNTSGDTGQFVDGVHDGVFFGTESTGSGLIRFIDIATMTPIDSRPDGSNSTDLFGVSSGHDGFNSQSHYIPHLDATWNKNHLMTWWRGWSPGLPLSEIVTDLMTRSDGDQRARLTPADIDVSELTDIVKGFAVLSQGPIRNYVTSLQQAYQFDAVESDGKIKFLKRGRAITTNLTEDRMAAHNYDSSRDDKYEPLNHERHSDVELPNELAVTYTSFEDELLQGTQRARRQVKDAQSNRELTLPIVLDKDEAAQIADIVLSEAWMARSKPFIFNLGPEHLRIDPSDVIDVTMRDGTYYKLRVVRTTIGANGIISCEAAEEFTSIYSSTAVGIENLAEPKGVPSDDLEPIIYDISARCLQLPETDNQAGVLLGIGSNAELCVGGTVWLYEFIDNVQTSFLAAAKGEANCACWGTCTQEIGHISGPNVTNVKDTEISIKLNILGGVIPESQTDAEALAGKQCLILGNEIIGFTTVTKDFNEGVIGTDIYSGGTLFAPLILSTTTDFTTILADGDTFTLRRENTIQPYRGKAYVAQTVTANQITIGTGQLLQGNEFPVAGEQVLIGKGPFNQITLTGLYRGLYGTENHRYHPEGEYATFTQELSFGPMENPPAVGEPLTAYTIPSGISQNIRTNKTIPYVAANLKPWPVQ